MNEVTRRLYLEFVQDRIQTALEAIEASSEEQGIPYYIAADLQQALEKLRLVQEAGEETSQG